jgi:hypothetical protein
MTTTQTTIQLDDATINAIEELKKALGVDNNAAVIRRALTITRFVVSQAGEDHIVTVEGKEKTNLVIRC